MTETAGTELVKAAGGITKFVESYADDFGSVVPKHVPINAFMGMAAAMIRSDKYLRDAAMTNPGSLILALRECAADGHVPRKGTAVLVPYRDKSVGWRVTYVEEVGGTIERMFRAGGVQSVDYGVVREKDRFEPVRARLPLHEYDWQASPRERGPLAGVYAWATLLTGALSRVVLLNRHDVAKYRAMSASARSKGGGNFWGPEWPDEGPNTEAMWVKTALHRLERYVPTSAAYRWEVAAADSSAVQPGRFVGVPGAAEAPVHTFGDSDVQDAEIVDDAASQGSPGWPGVTQPPADGGQ